MGSGMYSPTGKRLSKGTGDQWTVTQRENFDLCAIEFDYLA